jgi:hypothetical protein
MATYKQIQEYVKQKSEYSRNLNTSQRRAGLPMLRNYLGFQSIPSSYESGL